jgi:hypothetical protein
MKGVLERKGRRERWRDRKKQREGSASFGSDRDIIHRGGNVCVCERERERGGGGRQREREKERV